MILLTVVVVSACLALPGVQGQHDQTVEPGATGASVVEAVCSRIEASCVFSDDKLLTRRLSYVESHDGIDQDTFRMTYFGGIWQVDQAMFDLTRSSTARSYLLPYINNIKAAFGIDWLTISWEDLTKPLHSALGARLYLQYNSRNDKNGIPRAIDAQGDYWVKYYRPQSNRNDYATEANMLEQGCSSTNGADIVFVLDESGSVGASNFEKMKSFVVDVVEGYDVGPEEHQNRIGMIEYSTKASRTFDLKTYDTKEKVISAVKKMKYDGGNTYTDLALDVMVTKSFTASNGARPIENGHPRIGIVVTDGQSSAPSKTSVSARKAHDADITVFSVGVGSGVNLKELDTIASAPVCLHVMLLQGFTEFDSLKYAIEQRTCEAPIIISPGKNSTTGGHLPPGGDQNCKMKVPAEGITIELSSSNGQTTFYTSQSTYPSTEYFEEKTEATPGHIGVMFIPQPPNSGAEAYVFCNIKGDDNLESNITLGSKPGDHDACKNKPCKNNGVCVNMPGGGYQCECKKGYSGPNCEYKHDKCKPNPCKHGMCVPTSDSYTCVCHKHFTGVHCETKIRPCEPNPCLNGGTCDDDTSSGSGDDSKESGSKEDTKESGSKENGSKESGGQSKAADEAEVVIPMKAPRSQSLKSVLTKSQTGDPSFTCQCPTGFTGLLCETTIDPCDGVNCNQGTCVPTGGGNVKCECQDGITGQFCDTPIDPCDPDPCINARCISQPDGGYECICDDFHTGMNCESEITTTITTAASPSLGTYNCKEGRSPCTPENRLDGLYYFPHDIPAMFVQCDQWGQCFDMSCSPGLVWDTVANACNWP